MTTPTADLRGAVDAAASSTGFSGVVRVDRDGVTEVDAAYGLADRRHGIAMTTSTRLGTASAVKGLTAVLVLQLVDDGALSLGTRVRDVLGSDLPLVDDRVTVEHLLTHRSGIGDYVDEEAMEQVTDHVMTVPVHTLTTTEDYLGVLDCHPQVFEPGARTTYNNSGFVVLALVAGRVAGRVFEELLLERVCRPAGMASSAFLRSDELPADAATGYLWGDRPRTNVLHLPVVGTGDGGLYTTTADVAAFWRALDSGILLPEATLADALTVRGTDADGSRYGLGLLLGARDGVVALVGSDAGVSFQSVHDRGRGLTWTVASNTTEGAWPVARALSEQLAP
ncbi:serine hydrolase domain-containing protein [Oryzobacter terrae]|uniref:serine hydrolase domain-containing protein n=1 Tax=Oryzobacter terrae TaxID=1620385 RepID=UPI0036725F42